MFKKKIIFKYNINFLEGNFYHTLKILINLIDLKKKIKIHLFIKIENFTIKKNLFQYKINEIIQENKI